MSRTLLTIVGLITAVMMVLLAFPGCASTPAATPTAAPAAPTAAPAAPTAAPAATTAPAAPTAASKDTTPAAAPTTAAAPAKKIIFDFSTQGDRTDASWSQGIYEAYLQIKEKHPEVEATFTDLVAYNDWQTYFEMEAQKGANILFMDSPEAPFDALTKVAPKYPNIWFVAPDGPEELVKDLPGNVISWDRRTENAGFVWGVAAGLATKTNKLGFIGGENYLSVLKPGFGMELGAKWVNPKVSMAIMYTGDFVDVQKGYETGKAMLQTGVDFMAQVADNGGKGIVKAVDESDSAYILGEARDQSALSTKGRVPTSYTMDFPAMAELALQKYKDGTLAKERPVKNLSIKEGWPDILPFKGIADAAKYNDIATKVRDAIKAGKLEVPRIPDVEKAGKLNVADYNLPTPASLGIPVAGQ